MEMAVFDNILPRRLKALYVELMSYEYFHADLVVLVGICKIIIAQTESEMKLRGDRIIIAGICGNFTCIAELINRS